MGYKTTVCQNTSQYLNITSHIVLYCTVGLNLWKNHEWCTQYRQPYRFLLIIFPPMTLTWYYSDTVILCDHHTVSLLLFSLNISTESRVFGACKGSDQHVWLSLLSLSHCELLPANHTDTHRLYLPASVSSLDLNDVCADAFMMSDVRWCTFRAMWRSHDIASILQHFDLTDLLRIVSVVYTCMCVYTYMCPHISSQISPLTPCQCGCQRVIWPGMGSLCNGR